MQSVCFHSAGPALEYAQQEIPAAAVIDIHLPDGSGLDLIRQLRPHWGDDLPIVILSGDTSIETLRQFPELGATYFFSKPANAARLLDHLKRWTAGRKNQSTTPRTEPDA